MSVSGGAKPFRLRSIALSVYLPTLLFAVGQGAVVPIIPLFARDLGASVALAGVIVAVRGVGTMVFDVPAGMMVARLGERGAMLVGTAGLALVALGAGLSRSPIVFAVLMFVMGCGWSIWLLGRLSYATDVSPLDQRGRVLSLMGGVNRVGNFIGPFLGGLVADQFGLEAAFYTQAVLVTAAAGSMFFFVKDEGRPARVHGESAYGRLAGVVRDNRTVFATAGVATVAIQVLRSSRQAIIPLWGDHLGLDAGQVGVVFGLTSAIDMTLFYPVGMVMDRLGRKWAAVPCLLVMSLGMLLIPLTGSFATLLGAGLVTGLGNGFGSGINMTLGADFSPAIGRGEFLGVWRLIGDVGTAGGPMLVGALTAVASLGAASVATGGVGLAGAAVMIFLVPEPIRRSRTLAEIVATPVETSPEGT
ncbi:MAG TPA: MFS transporter [Tepidiformaceae bacterium]|nr:MFS transporter [Tepidiformaceae bacterium]